MTVVFWAKFGRFSGDDRCVYVDIHLYKTNVLDHVIDLMLIVVLWRFGWTLGSVQPTPNCGDFYCHALFARAWVFAGETRFQWDCLYVPNRIGGRCVVPMLSY